MALVTPGKRLFGDSTAADGTNDFDDVTVIESMMIKTTAWKNLAIYFDGDPAVYLYFSQQLCDGWRTVQLSGLAIECDVHGR